MPRPRPPSFRRPAHTRVQSSSPLESSSSTFSDPDPRPYGAAFALRSSPIDSPLEEDLDLELPAHLTSALRKTSLQHHRPSLAARSITEPHWGDTKDGRSGDENQDLVTSTSRPRPQSMSSDTTFNRPSWEVAAARRRYLRSDTVAESQSSEHASSSHESDVDRHDDQTAVSSPTFDKEWMGGLDRNELEDLLSQANAVIQERERDLGIAAAIGQALLQKNISLRSKHVGVMNQLDDSIGYDEENTPPVVDVPTRRSSSPSSAGQSHGYFFGDHGSHAAGPATPPGHRRPLCQVSNTSRTNGFPGMSPQTNSLVLSRPISPAHSKAESAQSGHHRRQKSAQTTATQRQLTSLSAQNEALLSRLTELQLEAEDARRDGSRKLRQLNRELQGLQAELQAATSRNDELEQTGRRSSGSQWKRRQGEAMVARQEASPEKPQRHSRESTRSSIHLSASASFGSMPNISDGIDAILARTGEEATSRQRAVVRRLLAKVRELEETNATLQQSKEERDTLLGDALKQGVKISNEYDALLVAHQTQAAVATTDTAASEETLTSADHLPSRSRALGNRVQVEGRRTVRTALRQHAVGNGSSGRSLRKGSLPSDFLPQEGDYWLPQSNTNSSLSSILSGSSVDDSNIHPPRRSRSAQGLRRPRILITPSMEDLAAKNREHAEVWPSPTLAASSLDPSDAKRIARKQSQESLGRRSIRHRQDSTSSIASLTQTELGNDNAHKFTSLGSELDFASRGVVDHYGPPTMDGETAVERPSHSISRPHLKSTASMDSLRSEAVSDIANVRWPESQKAGKTRHQSVAPRRLIMPKGEVPASKADLIRYTQPDEGEEDYSSEYEEDYDDQYTLGRLRDQQEPREEDYTFLNRIARREAVLWADDEDYGLPIKESEARRLGLLTGRGSRPPPRRLLGSTRLRTGWLGWTSVLTSTTDALTSQRGDKARESLAIMDAEQIRLEEREQAFLRAKYHRARRDRGFEDYMTDEEDVNDTQDHFRSGDVALRHTQAPGPSSRSRSHDDKDKAFTTTKPPQSLVRSNSNRKPRPLVSLATFQDVTAWASLVFVLIVAFFVSASRGELSPRRILGTSSGSNARARDERGSRKGREERKEQESERRRRERGEISRLREGRPAY